MQQDSIRTFGRVTFQDRTQRESFIEVIKDLDLTPPVVIKPNWGFSVIFTEATVLDWTLTAIDGDAIVVESYGWARCREAVEQKKYGSFDRDALRNSDKWFLRYSGIDKVLEKHDVEYINITEEIWAGRVVEQETIQRIVEDSYAPLFTKKMASFVPQRLYDMSDGTLLNLAKLKFMGEDIVISLTLKNLFGMIPGPDRGEFHGEMNKAMNSSIIDMNKIYRSLFKTRGVVEAVHSASSGMTLEPQVFTNPGVLWSCDDTLELDAVVTSHVGLDPNSVGYLKLAAQNFGEWDEEPVRLAASQPLSHFS
ncbi:MAG: DUF362 domain-containing protein [Candidatus Thorarchaeota archaeon SMTZ1-45]